MVQFHILRDFSANYDMLKSIPDLLGKYQPEVFSCLNFFGWVESPRACHNSGCGWGRRYGGYEVGVERGDGQPFQLSCSRDEVVGKRGKLGKERVVASADVGGDEVLGGRGVVQMCLGSNCLSSSHQHHATGQCLEGLGHLACASGWPHTSTASTWTWPPPSSCTWMAASLVATFFTTVTSRRF